MKRKDIMLAVAAAAVLGAFNPALAGGDQQSSAEERMSAPPVSEQSASPSMESSTDADVTAGANVGAESESMSDEPIGSTEPSVSDSRSSPEQVSQGPAVDVDPRTGLDEAHPAN